MSHTVAAFDFDGTITRCDTFPGFIRHVVGTWRMLVGFVRYTPQLLLYKLGIYPNWKVKQQIFAHFFKGMALEDFDSLCQDYFERHRYILSDNVCDMVIQHISDGHRVVIVSASAENWIKPFARHLGIDTVLGTRLQTDDQGRLTGRFASANCHGAEKVERLRQLLPDRKGFILHAYGDSKGDREMMEYADYQHWVKN